MNQNTTKRLDPMNSVMHYNLLEVAHELMVRKQNKAYWEAVPVPKQPVGQVRFEVARQVATFAVPLLGLVYAFMAGGLAGLVFALPVAWLVGFILDKMLMSAIESKRRRDEKIDSGRFRATKFLAQEMGMTPRDVTLPIIYKMAADFRQVDSKVKAAELQAELDRKEAIARSVRGRNYKGSSSATSGNTGAATSAAAVTGAVVAMPDTFVEYEDESTYSHMGDVNTSTGLPMIHGTPFDIAGNVFGTGQL